MKRKMLMMLWPPYRRHVLAEADEYIESFGERAYYRCRLDCIAAFEAADGKRARFLSEVRWVLANKFERDRKMDTETRYLEGSRVKEMQEPYDHGPGYVSHRPKDASLH